MSLKASVSPSETNESTSAASPMRAPKRTPGTRYGARVMFSIPPATTTSTSPVRIICEAIATDLRPDPHSMLIVVETADGRPDCTDDDRIFHGRLLTLAFDADRYGRHATPAESWSREIAPPSSEAKRHDATTARPRSRSPGSPGAPDVGGSVAEAGDRAMIP